MLRHLAALLEAGKAHLIARALGPPSINKTALPALILLSSQRGEGILRAQFFGNKSGQLGDMLPHQPSPEQWLDYWHRFVKKRGHIVDLVQRIGLIEVVSKETALVGKTATTTHTADEVLCFTLYTVQSGRGGAWSELVTVNRPRLKTARLAAWQSLLVHKD